VIKLLRQKQQTTTAMKITNIIHQDIRATYPKIHSVRLNTLFTFVSSGCRDQRVSTTYLGRGLKNLSKTTKKHDIKRSDRLVGNLHLHSERDNFYQYMTDQLVANQEHPIIIVDWSPINGSEIFQLHRASIAIKGRSLVIYEKVFTESELNTQTAHQYFLDKLEGLLPKTCKPIILSDAIYRSPWFKAVEDKGWYWVGRVRGQVSLSKDKEHWETSYQWFDSAYGGKAEYIGEVYYGKKAKFQCQAVIFKRSRKGRSVKKMRGGVSQNTNDKTHQKDAREPWLLVFKLPEKFMNKAKLVVNLYSQRMQIEENFRDTKNNKLGIGLECAQSRSTKRFDNLLLIAALILFVLWCLGYAATMKKYNYSLQANTVKHRAVLSFITIGREVVDDDRYKIPVHEFNDVLSRISKLSINIVDLDK
jgi:hypothetical protein